MLMFKSFGKMLMSEPSLKLVKKEELPSGRPNSDVVVAEPYSANAAVVSEGTHPVRSSRNRFIVWTFIVCALIPSIVYGAYLSLVASPQYKSEFRVLVRSSNGGMKGFDLSQVLGAASGKSSEDPYAVIQYVTSQQAVADLQRNLNIKEHFTSNSVDFFSRLGGDQTIEALTRYLKNYLEAYYETTTGTVVVTVTAFDPLTSQRIASGLLNLSEELVNRMSERSRKDLVSFSERSVSDSEQRLQVVSNQLLDLRNRGGVLDPQKYAAVSIERVAKLQDDLGELRAQVSVQRGYLSEDAPSVQLNLKRIEALENEMESVNEKITSSDPKNTTALSQTLREFEQVQTEREFAQKAYQAALVALQSARADAARQSLYLDTIIQPSFAEEQYYPKPIRDTLIFFTILSCAWAFLLLIGSSVRDHIS